MLKSDVWPTTMTLIKFSQLFYISILPSCPFCDQFSQFLFMIDQNSSIVRDVIYLERLKQKQKSIFCFLLQKNTKSKRRKFRFRREIEQYRRNKRQKQRQTQVRCSKAFNYILSQHLSAHKHDSYSQLISTTGLKHIHTHCLFDPARYHISQQVIRFQIVQDADICTGASEQSSIDLQKIQEKCEERCINEESI